MHVQSMEAMINHIYLFVGAVDIVMKTSNNIFFSYHIKQSSPSGLLSKVAHFGCSRGLMHGTLKGVILL